MKYNAGFVIYSPFASSCTNAQNTAKIGFITISIFPDFPVFLLFPHIHLLSSPQYTL